MSSLIDEVSINKEYINSCLTFQDEILPGVSRTFALTIPQLPNAIQIAVANAYLLCRITDTIEDTTILSEDEKEHFHDMFVQVVKGDIESKEFSEPLMEKLSKYPNLDELKLIENCQKVISITHSLTEEQRSALENCVTIMSDGMKDFEKKKTHSGLADIEEMNLYCYFVAGVVGEMLCNLFCSYSEEINSKKSKLKFLSVSFGQGLQMTNILKDIWDDKDREVCWLPQSVFEKHQTSINSLLNMEKSKENQEALSELISIAHGHLANALEYTLLLPQKEKGIRRFCLWALGMALLTLRKIEKNKDFSNSGDVKISRNTVKATILFSNIFTKSNFALRLMFNLLSRKIKGDQ